MIAMLDLLLMLLVMNTDAVSELLAAYGGKSSMSAVSVSTSTSTSTNDWCFDFTRWRDTTGLRAAALFAFRGESGLLPSPGCTRNRGIPRASGHIADATAINFREILSTLLRLLQLTFQGARWASHQIVNDFTAARPAGTARGAL